MTKRRFLFAGSLAVAVFLGSPPAIADMYDDFGDGAYDGGSSDPNDWRLDNPNWRIVEVVGVDFDSGILSDDVAETALHMVVTGFPAGTPLTGPYGVIGACPDDITPDPNLSVAYKDDSQSHYVLCWMYYANFPNDPNDDLGNIGPIIHGNLATYTGFHLGVDLMHIRSTPTPSGKTWPEMEQSSHHINLEALDITKFLSWQSLTWNFRRVWIHPQGHPDPNDRWNPAKFDPNDTTMLEPPEQDHERDPNYDDARFYDVDLNQCEREGFWGLIQFESDPNYSPGDPEGKTLRAAVWSGDKFNWDGGWLLEGPIVSEWWSGSEFGIQPWEPKDPNGGWYFAEGLTGFMVRSDEMWGFGYPGDGAFDHIEVRSDIFDPNSNRLQIAITNPENGYVTVDPDGAMMRDPNDPYDPNAFDPNDPNTYPEERIWRYTPGTEIVMVANPWPGGKGFNKWEVTDPLDANNSFTDTNTVLYLTMDRAWEVDAKFKCGSAALMPMIGLTLLALGVGVVIRRFA